MDIERFHHVAYRCKDAKQTVQWYGQHLQMKFVLAIAENQVPSTKQRDRYIHVIPDAGQGTVLAFFQQPNAPQLAPAPTPPPWVQHFPLKVATWPALDPSPPPSPWLVR